MTDLEPTILSEYEGTTIPIIDKSSGFIIPFCSFFFSFFCSSDGFSSCSFFISSSIGFVSSGLVISSFVLSSAFFLSSIGFDSSIWEVVASAGLSFSSSLCFSSFGLYIISSFGLISFLLPLNFVSSSSVGFSSSSIGFSSSGFLSSTFLL